MKIPAAEKTLLDNGIKVLTEKISTMRSIAVGIMVGAGSGDEPTDLSGISHFIEHMTFKGTEKRSAFEIAQAIDSVGGRINAFTGKESTTYYCVVLDTHLDVALDVLSDIFLNSLFDVKEIELEKGVVLEEIKMYEDTPDELIHDFFAETILGGHPLGKVTIGNAGAIKALNRDKILNFRRKLYAPDNLIISVAGNTEHSAVIKQIEAFFKNMTGRREAVALPPPVITPQIRVKKKKTEQVHLGLGVKGVSHLDEERYAFATLDNILGGSMSSRLFQEIREKRGLVYSIYSYNTAFRDFGIFTIFAGTSRQNLNPVVELALEEFRKVKKEGVSGDELKRAKEYLKGNLVLGLESTSSRMSWLARSEFYYNRVMTIDEVLEQIDKVTQDDIIRLANLYLTDQYLTLATIGDFEEGELPIKELRA